MSRNDAYDVMWFKADLSLVMSGASKVKRECLVHSVNEDIQSSTTSQVAERHFAQNLEMMRSRESSTFFKFCSHSRK